MSIEEKYDEVKELILMGKERGYLLYDEVNDLLPEGICSSDELDSIFSLFGSAGIEVIDSEQKLDGGKKDDKQEEEVGEDSEFDFGAITLQTVDEWIDCVKQLGLNQIDFHTGSSLRFGDCAPNPKLFPNGRANVKAVQRMLGHAKASMTLDVYADLFDEDLDDVADRLDAAIRSAADPLRTQSRR